MSVSEKELADFRREVTAWFAENKPAEPNFLMPESCLEVGTDEQFYFLREWQQKIYQAGYLGMAWPKEYGGGGRPQVYQDIVTAEMVRLQVPFMVNTIGLSWAGPLILQRGSEEQKKRYIPKILGAEEIWAQGFSEPEHGSDLGGIQLKAVRDGDEYVLNGSKIWTSLGNYAKHMILLARTANVAGNRYAGMSFFLAPMDVPGIEAVPIRKMTGEYGFTETFFTDARIPASCLIGEEGGGWEVAMATLQFERGVTGGQAGGHHRMSTNAKDVVELARRVKRDGRPAIEDPAIRDELVRFVIEGRSQELNAARTAIPALVSERRGAIPTAKKLVWSEYSRRLKQFALSLQGAEAAYYIGDSAAIDGGLWQRSYFNTFSACIAGGTSQIQMNIIGERVLGLPKS